ncbi:hypothetical protein Tco_1315855 [Tanacetum coccineum]
MLEKVKSPLCVEHKVKFAPPDYSKENYLEIFAPQSDLTPEQIFWSKDENDRKKAETSVPKPLSTPTVYPPNTPVKLIPRVLPTKSVTEGERGFEQPKRCYLTEVIPFFKTLKEHFAGVQTALFKEVKVMEEIFDQMSDEVDQNVVDKQCAKIVKKNLLIENENLIANCLSNQLLYDVEKLRCLDLEAEMSKVHDESKHILKLEQEYLNLQLKYQHLQESFDNNKSQTSQEAPDFNSFFKIKNLEHQIQEKDNVIRDLKVLVSNVNDRSCEPYNANDVTDLLEQNERLRAEIEKVKQHYKEMFESIKITRTSTNEKTSSLLTQIEDLKAQLEGNLKVAARSSVKTKVLAPGMYAIDVEPIPPRLKNNRNAHLTYINHLKESVETVREIVEEARVVKPLDNVLNYACQYTKLSQELVEYVIGTCPKEFTERDSKAPSIPLTRKKQITFTDTCRVSSSTRASGSKPRSNTKHNRILPAKSVNNKKVEDHPRTNKSVWTKVNRVDSSISSKHVVINSNSESVCKTCNKCLNSANHEICVVNILSSVNATPTVKIVLNKGKQIWKPKGKLSDNSLNKTKQIWQPKGKLFDNSLNKTKQDVKIILPKRLQIIFDALLGYVGLYTHHFSLSNLRLPIPSFICKVLNYSFGMVKLTTFAVMCRAYGGEPTVNLLRSFLNLGRAGDWLTLSNRGSADVPIALVKPITHLANWKGSFFYVENRIIPSDYPELLLESNKFDKKSFGDKVPLHPELDPLYDQISTYPCHVRTFPDPILYLAGLKNSWKHSPKEPVIYYRGQEMDFRSFMMQEIDGEFKFLPEGCIDDNQGSPSSKSVNNEAPVIDAKPLTSLHPSNFVEDVADSDDASAGDNENPLLGTSLPPLPEAASKVAGEASDPLDVDSDADIHEFPSAKELKDSADCHWVVAHVTPPSWKEHLRQISIKQLCDIHDRAYMRQVVLDNVLNSRTRELISALHKATASYDAIRARELEKDKAYAELERKCNEALLDLNKNPLVADMRTEIETLQGRVDGLHSECTRLILKEKKWINYDQTLSSLQSKIEGLESERETQALRDSAFAGDGCVEAGLGFGRCQSEVATLKDPFVMEKMAGYRPSSKQEYDQAGDDLANASYPFLSKYVNDPYASLEQLLSKKPESLRSKPSRANVFDFEGLMRVPSSPLRRFILLDNVDLGV